MPSLLCLPLFMSLVMGTLCQSLILSWYLFDVSRRLTMTQQEKLLPTHNRRSPFMSWTSAWIMWSASTARLWKSMEISSSQVSIWALVDPHIRAETIVASLVSCCNIWPKTKTAYTQLLEIVKSGAKKRQVKIHWEPVYYYANQSDVDMMSLSCLFSDQQWGKIQHLWSQHKFTETVTH